MPAVVTFTVDPYRIVEISAGGDNELNWQEIYSEWKEWVITNPGHPQAFHYEGAAVINPNTGEETGTTFFLHGPWKFRPAELDHRLTLVGNIYSTNPPGEPVIVPVLGPYTVAVELKVSNLVDNLGITAARVGDLHAFQVRNLTESVVGAVRTYLAAEGRQMVVDTGAGTRTTTGVSS